MNRKCAVAIPKESCPGSDSPILNYSAEQPDQLIFSSAVYSRYNPYRPPPILAGVYTALDCAGLEVSADSQEAADLLALQGGVDCTKAGGGV